MSDEDIEENHKVIVKPWHANSNGSIVVVIPKWIAEKSKIDTKSYVTIQGDSNGREITIKRLDLERLK